MPATIRVVNEQTVITVGENTLAAVDARIAAEAARDDAETVLAETEAVRDVIFNGLPLRFFNTKALATAALATIDADEYVTVLADESLGGARAVYQKSGGVLVLRGDLSAIRGTSVVVNGLNGLTGNARYAGYFASGTDAEGALLLDHLSGAITGLRINWRNSGSGFAQFHEYRYEATKGWYNYGPSHQIGGAAFESVKWGVITGDVIVSHTLPGPGNGYDTSGVDNSNFRRHFIPASARNDFGKQAGQAYAVAFTGNWNADFSMLSVNPDGPTTLELCASQYYDDKAYMISFRHRLDRTEIGGFNADGDWAMGDGTGWNQPRAGSAEVDARDREDTKIGRKQHSVFGMKKGGFSFAPYTVSEIVGEISPDQSGIGTVVHITDAPNPGLYVNYDGERYLYLVLDSAFAVYGEGYNWTVQRDIGGYDPATTTAPPRTFTRTETAGDAWDVMFSSVESITGDQEISFEINHVSNNPLLTVGFVSIDTEPLGTFESAVRHGFYQQNGILFRIEDHITLTGGSDFMTTTAQVGDEVVITKVGSTITATINGGAPYTITTTAANVAYRVGVAFNHTGASVKDLRHRAL